MRHRKDGTQMEKRKLPYEEAKIEVIEFERPDIITMSDGNIDDDGLDGEELY